MSHCLIVKQDDNVFIGSDTAASTKINDKYYRIKGNINKLFKLDDLLLFCSGKLSVISPIIERLNRSSFVNLDIIKNVTEEMYKQYDGNEDIDIVVVDKDSKVFTVSPYNNFKVNELVSNDGINVWSAGIKTVQGVEFFENEVNNGNTDILNIYQNVFNKLSSEVIGGELHFYNIDKNGISDVKKSQIKEKSIDTINCMTYQGIQLVVAERLIGKAILGEKLTIGDEEGTFDIVGNLLTIKDRDEIVRLRLGEYTYNEFGLQLMNKTGQQVILDENGILQTWQEGRSDNVDTSHGLTLYVYLPNDTLSIRQAKLNFRLLPFRSYAGTTESGGASIQTSASGGGVSTSTASGGSSTQTSSSGGGTSKSTSSGGSTTQSSSSGGNHTHVMFSAIGYGDPGASHTVMEALDGTFYVSGVAPAAKNYSTRGGSGNHTHSVSIPSHAHGFSTPNHSHSVSIPSHFHNFTIPSHSHNVTIPSHKHDIAHGIYVSTFARGVGVIINNIDRTSQLGGKFDASQANVDIGEYLETGKWNEIELTADTLGRIDGNVFIQAFMGT